MPATAQVFTSQFIEDVAATSVQEVLVNYSGLVGADPNNSSAPLNNFPGDRDGSGGGLGIRGLASVPPKRDGLVGPRSTARTLGQSSTGSAETRAAIPSFGDSNISSGAGSRRSSASRPASIRQPDI